MCTFDKRELLISRQLPSEQIGILQPFELLLDVVQGSGNLLRHDVEDVHLVADAGEQHRPAASNQTTTDTGGG